MRVVLNEQSLIGRLRRRNLDLQTALDTLRATAHRLNQTEELTRTDELTGLTNRRGFTPAPAAAPPHRRARQAAACC